MNVSNVPYIQPRENNLYVADTYSPSNEYVSTLLNGIKYGVVLFILIVIIWVAWAELVLKWSIERVGGLMLEKYKFNDLMKPKEEQIVLGDYQYLSYSNVVIAGDRSYATCNINIADSKTHNVISSVAVKYYIIPNCQTEDNNDAECIRV